MIRETNQKSVLCFQFYRVSLVNYELGFVTVGVSRTLKYRQLTFLTLNDYQHDSNDEPKSHGEQCLSF